MTSPANKKNTMYLYSYNNDIKCHRARFTIAEKGIAAEVVFMEKGSEPKEFLDLSNKGQAPLMIDRGLNIQDSRIMLEYFDERFPHPPLMPAYPVERARLRDVVLHIDTLWYTLADVILKGGKDADKARDGLRKEIEIYTPLFNEKEFFMSDEFGLMDCCLMPLLWRLPALGIHLTKDQACIQNYMNRLFARDTFQDTLTDEEREMVM